jgi:signal transduction histidine kinase
MMQKSTRQVTILMDEIIGLSLIDSTEDIKLEDETHINRMLSQLTEEYKDYATSETEVKLETELPDDYTLKTNENMLRRTLNCLMENAVKYTQEGSITVKSTEEEGMLKIAIEDTGSGVPEEEAEHIFDRFVKLDNFKAGIGLGLSLSRKLAKQLGGNVELDTTYKDGARFIVTLPTTGNAN